MQYHPEAKRVTFPLWQRLGLFGLVFWIGAVGSRYLSVSDSSYVPVWIPAGIYLAVLLLNATREWPWFMLAALVANLAFDLPAGTHFGTALGFCLANTVEAVTGAWLVRRFVAERPDFSTLKQLLRFIGLTAGVGTVVGATVGAATLVCAGASQVFFAPWETWWSNENMAILLVTPFILCWFSRPATQPPLFNHRGQYVEALVLLAVLSGFTWYLLVVDKGIMAPYKSRLMPFLLWAGIRFGLRGVTFANLLLGILMAFLTTHFLKGLTPEQITHGAYMSVLQSYLAMAGLIALVPTVVLAERNRSLRKLAESERRFRQFTEASFEGIAISANGRVLDVNEELVKLLRCQRSDIVGREILEFVAPQSRVAVIEAVRSGRELTYENWLLRPDGSTFLAETHAKIVPWDGQAVRMTAVRDITERKRAEAESREREIRFHKLFEGVGDMLFVFDVNGRILDVNQAACTGHDYTKEELLQFTVADMKAGMTPDKLEGLQQRLRSKVAFMAEGEHRRKDGSVFPVEVRVSPLDLGDPPLAIAVVRDVTERRRSEENLRSSEERLNTIFQNNPVALSVSDVGTGQFLFVNQAFVKLMRATSADQIVGKRSVDLGFVTMEQRATLTQAMHDLGQIGGFVAQFRRLDGELFFAEVYVGPHEHQGKHYFLSSIVDVTERKKLAEALERTRTYYKTLLETASDGIHILDDEGNLAEASDAFYRMLGHDPENPPKLKVSDWDARWTAEELKPRMTKHLMEAEVFETIHRRQNGEVFPVEISVRGLEMDGKRYIYAASRDITTRKNAEEKIHEQARLIEEADDAIVLRDLDGVIQMWNHGAESIFGWSAAEAVGRKPVELGQYGAHDFSSAMGKVIEDGVWAGELSGQTKDGRYLEIESRWTLLRDAQGQPQKVLSISHDVTAAKKLEAQLLRAERMQTIGTLSGGVAHDLNNILSPFLVGLPILREEAKSPETRELLDLMESSIRRGADIVKQLLLFGRGGDAKRVPTDPCRQIREVAKIIRETFPKNLTLNVSCPEGGWPILADPTQIYQVVLNLAVNARDAMPGGGTLTIAMENIQLDQPQAGGKSRAKPGPYVVLTVRDTGDGMSPEVLDRIFDPFFTTKELGKGTGLGLSVVIGVVENHDGFINVQSTVGQGSEFKIHLPALPASATSADTGFKAKLPRGRGETILLVDDEPALLKVLGRILEKHGYKTLAAGNGAEALKLFGQDGAIKAVISDFSMPGMDGLALAEALKQINSDIKIIIATGLDVDLDAARIQELGLVTVLKKPYTAETVLQTLEKTLAGKKALFPM